MRAALRPCTYPGCGALCAIGRCPQHLHAERKQQDARRGNRHVRGYGNKWATYSASRLRRYPLCECPECKAGEIRVRRASVTDHIVPHKGDMAVFWDKSNHQSMAKECHDAKTAREDGGFGNFQR